MGSFFPPWTTSFPFPFSMFTGAGDSSASSPSSSQFKTANRFMYLSEGDREGGATTRGLALVPGCNCECSNCVGLGGAEVNPPDHVRKGWLPDGKSQASVSQSRKDW